MGKPTSVRRTKSRTSLVKELTVLGMEDESTFFTKSDREMLLRLAEEPETEGVWTQIEKTCGLQPILRCHAFIREIVANRRLAERPRDWPNYKKAAVHAQSLAQFLKGSGQLPPPLPMSGLYGRVEWLESIASTLRERAANAPIKVSRQSYAGSRGRKLFVNLMSSSVRQMFGYYLDNPLAELTNCLYKNTSPLMAETVRKARRKVKRNHPSADP